MHHWSQGGDDSFITALVYVAQCKYAIVIIIRIIMIIITIFTSAIEHDVHRIHGAMHIVFIMFNITDGVNNTLTDCIM